MNFKNFDWRIGSFLVLYQIALLITLPIYLFHSTPGTGVILTAIALFFLTGISITAGYHRLFAHKSYNAHKFVEAAILFFSTLAVQGSALKWSYVHRLHHRFVDRDKDPHNINKGFMYAHMLWMLEKHKPIDEKIIPDLMRNRLLVFQHKYYSLLTFSANALVFIVAGLVFKDFLGAFMLVIWTRLFLLHHFTWFINSLAHTFGAKTYSKEQTAVNNAIIAFLTFGEGYHNYHHVFSSDYRNGIRWYQYDPTKWLIWLLNKIGLASNLNRVDKYISKSKIIIEDRHIFLRALSKSTYKKKQLLEQKVIEISDQITKKIAETKQKIREYRVLKNSRAEKSILKSTKERIRNLKSSIRTDWSSWRKLEKEISKHAVLHYNH